MSPFLVSKFDKSEQMRYYILGLECHKSYNIKSDEYD